jgi:transcriptional regulator GlxA family with amidase domain
MKRYPLLSGTFVLAFLLASAVSAQQKPAGEPITVGILLLNKPYITEFAGPLDVYHHVPAEKLKVFIISDTDQELVTYEGMPFRANYTIDNAPKLDVLVVPSGAGSLDADLKNVRVISWLQKVAKDVQFITSHCEGAFLLGQAGLLDNKQATTFPVDTEALQKQFPACRVQAGQRIVVVWKRDYLSRRTGQLRSLAVCRRTVVREGAGVEHCGGAGLWSQQYCHRNHHQITLPGGYAVFPLR